MIPGTGPDVWTKPLFARNGKDNTPGIVILAGPPIVPCRFLPIPTRWEAGHGDEKEILRHDSLTGRYKYLFIRTINPEVSVVTSRENPRTFFSTIVLQDLYDFRQKAVSPKKKNFVGKSPAFTRTHP